MSEQSPRVDRVWGGGLGGSLKSHLSLPFLSPKDMQELFVALCTSSMKIYNTYNSNFYVRYDISVEDVSSIKAMVQ